MSVSAWLDLIWAHILAMGGGGMMNPFDYRDLMRAHMRYNEERTVEQVQADIEARDRQPAQRTGPVDPEKPPPLSAGPSSRQLADLRKLMEAAKTAQAGQPE